MAKDAPGMRGYRSRNEDGELRQKRGDTHVGTIEKQYKRDFGIRSDTHLNTLLEREGLASLNDLINSSNRKGLDWGCVPNVLIPHSEFRNLHSNTPTFLWMTPMRC